MDYKPRVPPVSEPARRAGTGGSRGAASIAMTMGDRVDSSPHAWRTTRRWIRPRDPGWLVHASKHRVNAPKLCVRSIGQSPPGSTGSERGPLTPRSTNRMRRISRVLRPRFWPIFKRHIYSRHLDLVDTDPEALHDRAFGPLIKRSLNRTGPHSIDVEIQSIV